MRIGKLFAGAIVGAALLVGLTACGGGSSDGGAVSGPTINVSLKEFSIAPTEIHIPAGGATLVVKNEGTMPHNFQIPSLGIQGKMLSPGDTDTIKVKGDKKGTFQGSCGVAGHLESGMVTQVMVE